MCREILTHSQTCIPSSWTKRFGKVSNMKRSRNGKAFLVISSEDRYGDYKKHLEQHASHDDKRSSALHLWIFHIIINNIIACETRKVSINRVTKSIIIFSRSTVVVLGVPSSTIILLNQKTLIWIVQLEIKSKITSQHAEGLKLNHSWSSLHLHMWGITLCRSKRHICSFTFWGLFKCWGRIPPSSHHQWTLTLRIANRKQEARLDIAGNGMCGVGFDKTYFEWTKRLL